MSLELFFNNKCGDGNAFIKKIKEFSAIMPFQKKSKEDKTTFKLVEHSKESGLINFDFAKEGLSKLLDKKEAVGLRIIPAVDNDGELTVVITAYDANGDEVYSSDGKLLADCCPQPPPPYNLSSKLYRQIFD